MSIYIGLGSNLGDRKSHLSGAIAALNHAGVRVSRSASVYETEPWGDSAGQPPFLNTVVEAESVLPPNILMDLCLRVEREAGRFRIARNAPRAIDIDILYIGSHEIQLPGLIVPHPRIARRRFVLAPLAEIAPDFVDPGAGVTVRELLAACQDASAVEIHAPPLL
jgi:2-amino-4-hydroxy-6-hydroxymethyldihydropteridine diphosphokinase